MNLVSLFECDQGRYLGSAKGGVAVIDDPLEVVAGDFGRRDVERKNTEGEFREGEVLELGEPIIREFRGLLGNEEAAILSKTF